MVPIAGQTILIKFDVGGRIFHMPSCWSLFDLELLLEKRLPIDEPVSIELQGETLFLCDYGFLLHICHPNTGTIVEAQYALWAFPGWLDYMEEQGTPRALVVGSAGLQALEWWGQYQPWARAEELEHARWLIENQQLPFDKLLAIAPRLADDLAFQAYRGRLENAGKAPKNKRGGRGKDPQLWNRVRELGLLAIDLYRTSPGVLDFAAACREACILRSDWVPEKHWIPTPEKAVGDYLCDTLRKSFNGTVYEDFRFLEAPAGWTERKALNHRKPVKSSGKK